MADSSEPSARKALVTKTSAAKAPVAKPAPKKTYAQNTWYTKPRRGVKIDAILGSALEALQANRMRSFLTMLGVIIGVSAVIAVVSLTQGVNQSVSAIRQSGHQCYYHLTRRGIDQRCTQRCGNRRLP